MDDEDKEINMATGGTIQERVRERAQLVCSTKRRAKDLIWVDLPQNSGRKGLRGQAWNADDYFYMIMRIRQFRGREE
jgi:hypothetical protein